MADSLDDFFAKKDKKRRNKNQSSVLSAETLVRELEEGSRQSEYSSRRDGKTSAAMELLGLDTNDNDWKDFEEVEKRDYTGLKVKEMSIQDQEEEHRRLTEKTEQVPEVKPWKSKEGTVAAILSTRDDADLLSSELLAAVDEDIENDRNNDGEGESDKPTTDATKPDSSNDNSKAAVTTNPEASDQGGSKVPETTSETTPSASVAPKKDDEPSSKPKYRPPHERFDSEVQALQPIKLSAVKSSSRSNKGNQTLDIEDEQAFPTLG